MTTLRKITANFVETEIDDEILLVDLDGGELFSLSGTAREIWRLIDGKRSEADIVSAMSETHHAATDRISEDVALFLGKLQKASLVERRDLSSGSPV